MKVTDLPPDTWHPFKEGMFHLSKHVSDKMEDQGRLFLLLRGYDAEMDCASYTIKGTGRVPQKAVYGGNKRIVGVLRLDARGAMASLGITSGVVKTYESDED